MARALFGPDGQCQILLEHLPTLTTPTLVIWGGCDYVLPARQAQAAVDLLPNGRLALFPHCGHLPHVEQPERFTTVLSEWLTEHLDDTVASERKRRDSGPRAGAASAGAGIHDVTPHRVGGVPQPGRSLRPAHRRLPAVA
jgi:hypothetical protein